MSEDTDENSQPEGDQTPAKRSKLPLLIALVLFLAASAGGFFATFSGALSVASLIGGKMSENDAMQVAAISTPTYVSLGEIIVPLGPDAKAEFLLMTSEIEVAPEDVSTFEALLPRIQDLFNTYLRAVEARDLEQPDATMRLRDQLLRRLRVIAEPASPRDLLFTSFILR